MVTKMTVVIIWEKIEWLLESVAPQLILGYRWNITSPQSCCFPGRSSQNEPDDVIDCLCHLLAVIFGPILWGHSSPLCHVLSLLLSLLSWTSMRRRCPTVAACDSSDTWWMAM